MMKTTKPMLASFAVSALTIAGAHGAATTLAYWDFDTGVGNIEDSVGGIATTAVNSPDISTHATYGASGGSGGNSLNLVISGTGYLSGDVFGAGSSSALDFGTGNFSVSYWVYDDSSDLDDRAVRIFDMMDGTLAGFQILGSTAPGLNMRVEGSSGSEIIINEGTYTRDKWEHVVVTMDRSGNASVYIDGALSGFTTDITSLSGNVNPTRDITIGVNTIGGTAGGTQSGGIDDLAFYSGILDSTQIAALAAGTALPSAYVVPEPSSAALLGLGGLALVLRRRK
ncbi:MAG: LamG domain-containing protein [Akkermansiaceae bacterium]|nr:LamG domain-containing protein [Akkermansiaceae bacterium]